jgi:hypothetical protein
MRALASPRRSAGKEPQLRSWVIGAALVVCALLGTTASASSAAGHGNHHARQIHRWAHGRVSDVPAPPGLILTVRPGAVATLLSAPYGQPVLSLRAVDEYGQPTRFGVVSLRWPWAGVSNANLGSSTLGWIKLNDPALDVSRTGWLLVVHRGAHQLIASDEGRVEARFAVGVGAPSSPTPLGSFSVTDKLAGAAFGRAYGCCILALSTVQPHPPDAWWGPVRMAIHGTDEPQSVGANMSAGCVHVAEGDLRWLIARVPTGAPVVIEA